MDIENLYHFYHIYADGNWQKPLLDHLTALSKSKLLYNLNGFYIGLVGSKENRDKVKIFLNRRGHRYIVCAESNSGYEQITLDPLLEFANKKDGYVLYAHTKNASRPSVDDIQINWRKTMTYSTVMCWENCVSEIKKGAAAAGCFYLPLADYGNPYVVADVKDFGYFGGNYWWSNLSYIRYFPKCPTNDRFDAERWIAHLKLVYEHMGKDYYVYDNFHVPIGAIWNTGDL